MENNENEKIKFLVYKEKCKVQKKIQLFKKMQDLEQKY